jgi:hypothetical protein
MKQSTLVLSASCAIAIFSQIALATDDSELTCVPTRAQRIESVQNAAHYFYDQIAQKLQAKGYSIAKDATAANLKTADVGDSMATKFSFQLADGTLLEAELTGDGCSSECRDADGEPSEAVIEFVVSEYGFFSPPSMGVSSTPVTDADGKITACHMVFGPSTIQGKPTLGMGRVTNTAVTNALTGQVLIPAGAVVISDYTVMSFAPSQKF